MKIKKTMVLILFILLSLSLFLVGCAKEDNIKNITPSEAYTLLQENKDNPNFHLLDVRTLEEFSEEHIEGAINIDYYQDSFREDIDSLEKENTYLIYCGSGKRGGMALDIMKELEFKEAYNIEGGLGNCQEEGFEIVK